MIGLRVWIPRSYRLTTEDVESLRITAPDGHQFPLKRVAHVETIRGQPQITRDNLKQMVAVTSRISGRDLGSTIRDVTKVLDRPGFLPAGVYYQLGGLYEQQQLAFRGLLVVFAAAVLLVFVLLLFLYESFRVAIAMMFTTLLAVAAVFIGLWLTGTELNITAMMGMTMVVGIVTEVSIFYYSEFQELEPTKPTAATIASSRGQPLSPHRHDDRRRHSGLLPLALGIGPGSALPATAGDRHHFRTRQSSCRWSWWSCRRYWRCSASGRDDDQPRWSSFCEVDTRVARNVCRPSC